MLSAKTVLIAGVGPGLGMASAGAALRDGANVIGLARNGDRLKSALAALDPDGDRTLSAVADITDQGSLDTAVAAGVDRFGGIDGVVSVAAFDAVMGRMLDLDVEISASVFDVNVSGTIRLVKATRPALTARGGGSVVIIGSQSSLKPNPIPQGPYGPSKAALLAVARDLAVDLGAEKIRVNTVVPTWMWGPNVERYCAWQAAERNTTAEAIRDEIANEMALGEMPAADDVAEAVIFFLSDRARLITGQRLLVNAGEYFDT